MQESKGASVSAILDAKVLKTGPKFFSGSNDDFCH